MKLHLLCLARMMDTPAHVHRRVELGSVCLVYVLTCQQCLGDAEICICFSVSSCWQWEPEVSKRQLMAHLVHAAAMEVWEQVDIVLP